MSTTTKRRRRPGFRMRVLGVLAVVLVGASTVGLLLQRAVLRERLDRQVDRDHDQERTELESLVSGRDPETGRPFGGDVAAIFDTFLRRNVPGTGEAYLTFVDGQVHGSSRASDRLRSDPQLIEQWRDLERGERGWAETENGPLRWLAAPLQGTDGTAGVFIVATFLQGQRDEIDSSLQVEAIVSAIVLLVALAVAWSMAGALLQPVSALTTNARHLDERDLSARIPESGNDEIAQLARTYNAMLDRLQLAFETQRRFIDAAGHELRTPITIVRGHIELMGDDPDDRRETVAIVTDELDRMTRMVDDLVVLARAEQPNFVEAVPTEATTVTESLLDRAWTVGDRNWVVDSIAEGTVSIDSQRMIQAGLNLVRNAVEHTHSGDEIGIGTAWEGDELLLWVRDRGPGVPPADRDRIFERFARGASGRSRSEGAGLGLSIVEAIAHAHGGRVGVTCPPEGGSVFTIAVPAGNASDQAPDRPHGRT